MHAFSLCWDAEDKTFSLSLLFFLTPPHNKLISLSRTGTHYFHPKMAFLIGNFDVWIGRFEWQTAWGKERNCEHFPCSSLFPLNSSIWANMTWSFNGGSKLFFFPTLHSQSWQFVFTCQVRHLNEHCSVIDKWIRCPSPVFSPLISSELSFGRLIHSRKYRK